MEVESSASHYIVTKIEGIEHFAMEYLIQSLKEEDHPFVSLALFICYDVFEILHYSFKDSNRFQQHRV